MSLTKPNKITINITQEHIDKGLIKSSSNCPIALAIKEQNLIMDNETIKVMYAGIDLFSLRGSFALAHYDISSETKQFMENFDNKKEVTPQTFTFIKNKEKSYEK